jgi:hypothetical protein
VSLERVSLERVSLERAGRVVRPASLIAATALLLSPGLWLGPGLDAAVYTLSGLQIRDGRMPYVDLFDHKPPGLYLVNALGQVLLPWLDPWPVAWLLSLAFTAAAILVVDRMVGGRASARTSYIASLVCLTGMAACPVALGGGLTEPFAVLPLVIALRLAAGAPGWRASALVACLCSLACLFSLQALPAAAVLVLASVVGTSGTTDATRGVGVASRRAEVARRAVAALGGGLVVPLAVAGWLIARGAMADAIDQVIFYNGAYRAASPGLGHMLAVTAILLACLLVPLAITVGRMARDPRSFDRVSWLSVVWIAGVAALLVFENRLFLHYLILLMPPLILLWAPGVAWLSERARPAMGRRPGGLALVLVAAMTVLATVSAVTVVGLTAITTDASAKAQAVTDTTAAWLKANTPATTSLFLWGDDTYLYLDAGRPPYDRYVYQFPMVMPGYWSTDRTAALLSAWHASPPQVIVESPTAVPLFRPPTPSDDRYYDTLGPLRDFVRARYRLVASFGAGPVFEDVYRYSPSG